MANVKKKHETPRFFFVPAGLAYSELFRFAVHSVGLEVSAVTFSLFFFLLVRCAWAESSFNGVFLRVVSVTGVARGRLRQLCLQGGAVFVQRLRRRVASVLAFLSTF